MSDKYEFQETEEDNKIAIGGGIVATVLSLLAFGIRVFSDSKQTNKDIEIDTDKNKFKN